MITLLKLNLLDSKNHIIYSRDKIQSKKILSDIFSEFNNIMFTYGEDLSDKDINKFKTIAQNRMIGYNKHDPNAISSLNFNIYYPGMQATSFNYIYTGLDIVSTLINENKILDLQYNVCKYIDRTNYNIVVFDKLEFFMSSIIDNDSYYYINSISYKYKELIEYISDLIGEKK